VKHRQWVRAGVDYAAPIAFAIAFFATRNFQTATWVLVGASALALAVGFLVERRVAPLPLLAGVTALIFGGLTLIFQDERFVKMKLTFVNGGLAIALVVGVLLGKNPMKALLGEAMKLPDPAWRTLSFRYAAYFAAVAVVNEIVWRNFSDADWVKFRVVLLPLALVFSLTQVPFFMKHMKAAEAPEPPDPGF
jgi:intracellular septation protein